MPQTNRQLSEHLTTPNLLLLHLHNLAQLNLHQLQGKMKAYLPIDIFHVAFANILLSKSCPNLRKIFKN